MRRPTASIEKGGKGERAMRGVWSGSAGAWRVARQCVSAIVLPQLVLSLALQHGRPAVGVGVAGGWTAFLLVRDLHRSRSLDPLVLYGLAITVLQSVLALATGNPVVYVGGGVAENLLDGLGLLGSIAVSRPLLLEVARRVRGAGGVRPLPRPGRRAVRTLTFLWGLGFLARAGGLYWALTHLTLGAFLVVNVLGGWPLTAGGALASLAWIRLRVLRDPNHAPGCGIPACWAGCGV